MLHTNTGRTFSSASRCARLKAASDCICAAICCCVSSNSSSSRRTLLALAKRAQLGQYDYNHGSQSLTGMLKNLLGSQTSSNSASSALCRSTSARIVSYNGPCGSLCIVAALVLKEQALIAATMDNLPRKTRLEHRFCEETCK